MDTTITTLLTATGGAFLGKFVGPAAEQLGKAAWERAQQLGQQAHNLLTAVGREPQPVEPKLLVPLVQAAALETDESLADKWAALLANAADPARRVAVQPGFAGVLRELTPVEAQILERIYANVTAGTFHAGAEPDSVIVDAYEKELNLSSADFEVCMDNLIRLRLCGLRTKPFNINQLSVALTPATWVVPTRFGQAFLLACTPPAHTAG
jgi:hypothetical protein